MSDRPNATYPEKIACLILLAHQAGTPFICGICGKPIVPGQPVQFDHHHAVGRGGAHSVKALRPVHAAKTGDFDCHTRKTAHPRGPHTAIGGDTYEAAKTKRLEAMTRFDHAVRHGAAVRPPGTIRSKPFQSRANAWPPRGSRPMNKKRRA